MQLTWEFKKFESLTSYELYAILQLRNEIFVVEQNCVFQDADNKDQSCYHLMGWQKDKLVAYTRIVPPGVIYPEPSIGRVVTSANHRRSGIGKILMQESLDHLFKIYGKVPVKIGAQLYLKDFYESFGFQQTGEVYLEDGIKHIEMIRQ